ncbi:MAG: lipoprotein-releasing ABC transporter ATP-binding protein LolD [Succinivibrio sp.]|nr:lipoprotein-releasing ABC transporter ATP-binding protein LolD [Succinivibrio sp.]
MHNISNSSLPVLLKACELTKTYEEGPIKTEVLRKVNLSLREGELTAIIGKSGSGKSTLLHILGTLDTPTSGELLFEGVKLTDLSSSEKARLRNQKIGFIYQFHHLLEDFTAKENVMMPLLIGSYTQKEASELASEYLAKVGLYDRQQHKPSELSGGERQRVAIARALVTSPDLIFADEPTGNLDALNAKTVFKLFYDLVHAKGTTVLMVTHDEGLASLCDRVLRMQDGVIDA